MFGVNVVHATRRRQLETPLLASRADPPLPSLHFRGPLSCSISPRPSVALHSPKSRRKLRGYHQRPIKREKGNMKKEDDDKGKERERERRIKERGEGVETDLGIDPLPPTPFGATSLLLLPSQLGEA